jgi:hypothetical protein
MPLVRGLDQSSWLSADSPSLLAFNQPTLPRNSMLRSGILLSALVLALAACSKNETEDSRANLTERQKDSLIARSPIPGAKAVQKALNTADSAAARQARIDSAQQNP